MDEFETWLRALHAQAQLDLSAHAVYALRRKARRALARRPRYWSRKRLRGC